MGIVKKVFNAITGEKAFFIFIVAVMVALPLSELIGEFFGVFQKTQVYVLQYLGIAGGVVFMLSALKRLFKGELFPSDLLCVMLIIYACISLMFTQNIKESISLFYSELIYHFIAYFCLMYSATMLSSEKLRKGVLYVFLGVAVFNVIIALLQTFGIVINPEATGQGFDFDSKACFGFTMNINFYAGLACVFTAAGLGAFFFMKNKLIRISALVVAALGFYTSICTGARIAWVGNIAIVFFYIVSFIIMARKNPAVKSFLKILGIIVLVAVLILGIILAVNSGAIMNGIEETISQSGQGFDTFATYRGGIWRYGIASVGKYWATGTGLNNYIQAYYDFPERSPDIHISRKAHNEYIHTLATQGVFAFAFHLLTHIYACFVGIRTVLKTKNDKNRYITWIFLGMFITYWCQSMFNVSVISVAPYFWISVGMIMPVKNQNPMSFKLPDTKKAPYQIRPTVR